jgi:hypothetical protein
MQQAALTNNTSDFEIYKFQGIGKIKPTDILLQGLGPQPNLAAVIFKSTNYPRESACLMVAQISQKLYSEEFNLCTEYLTMTNINLA